MHRRKLIAAVLAACAIAALGAGIAQGSSTKSSTARGRAAQASGRPPGPGGGWAGGPGGAAVHSVSVVLDKAGTGYVTQTTDEGTIESVDSSAETVTILEGTKSVTYKTLTLNVPSGATIMLDGKTSTLSALAAGDHVSISSSSEGTSVFATDSSFHPEGGPGRAGPGMPPGQGSAPGAVQ